MSYEVKGPDGSGIIYIEDTKEYKIIVDKGDAIYVFDTPDNAKLSDLSSYQAFTGDNNRVTQSEKDAREDMQSQGILITTTNEAFLSGFYKDDRLVSVPRNISNIESFIDTDAVDVLVGFDEAVASLKSDAPWWNSPNYVDTLNKYVLLADGNVSLGYQNFKNSDEYGQLISGMGYTKSMINSYDTKRTDPIQYERNYLNYLDVVNATLLKNGAEIPEEAAQYMARQWANGVWTQTKVVNQINAATDDYSPYNIDTGLLGVLEGKSVTKISTGEDLAQQLMDKYLPSSQHGTINIQEEGGKLRNIGNYQAQFISDLKAKRFATYQMYDENIPWENILIAKKQAIKNIWGVDISVNDDVLDTIIRMNDTAKENGYLRQEGLNRNIPKVVSELNTAMMSQLGTGIIESQQYVEGR